MLLLDEYNEEAHRELMRSFAESGDKPGAIQEYMRCRELLASELELEPDAKTAKLYQEIHDFRSVQATAISTPKTENIAPATTSLLTEDLAPVCPKCGGIVPQNANYCLHCGGSITSGSLEHGEASPDGQFSAI